MTHVHGETQFGRQTFRRAVEQVRRRPTRPRRTTGRRRAGAGARPRGRPAPPCPGGCARPGRAARAARGCGRRSRCPGAAPSGPGLLAQPRADRLRGGVLQRGRPPRAPAARCGGQPQAAGAQPLGERRLRRARPVRVPTASLSPACGRLEAVSDGERWRSGGTARRWRCRADEPVVTAVRPRARPRGRRLRVRRRHRRGDAAPRPPT